MFTSTSGFNAILSQMLSEWWNEDSGWVGAALAPMFRTGEQSAQYAIFDKENFLRRPKDIRRAPGTKYSESGLQLSADTFLCEDKGHVVNVDETQRKKYRRQLDANMAALKRAMMVVRSAHEHEVKDLVDSAGVPSVVPTTKWDDAASDVIGDLRVQRKAFRDGSGLKPNTLIINEDIAEALWEHPQLVEKFKYSRSAVLNNEDIAKVLRIPRVIIAGEFEDTGEEGLTANLAEIWGDTAILAHTNTAQSLEVPNALRTFVWSEDSGSEDEIDVVVETNADWETRSEAHRVRHNTGVKLTGNMLIRKFTDVLS